MKKETFTSDNISVRLEFSIQAWKVQIELDSSKNIGTSFYH